MDGPKPNGIKAAIQTFEKIILTAFGVAATLLMFGNAAGRYILGRGMVWAEEVIRMLFVWAMFFAISAAFVRNDHIGFDGLTKKGGKLGLISRLISSICLFGVGATLAWFGFRYNGFTGKVPLPATNLPSSLFMWPGILAGAFWAALGAYRVLAAIVKHEKRGA